MTEWEPREALLAGPDGLDAIRALLSESARAKERLPSRWGRARPQRSGRCCPRPDSVRLRRGPTWPGSSGWWWGGRDCDGLDRARRCRAGANRTRALRSGRWSRGLPCRRPLRTGLRSAQCGGDRADPPDQGAGRRQVFGSALLLAAGDARAGRRAGESHPGGGRARCCRARSRSSSPTRASISAGLSRGSGATWRAADRRARSPGRCARSSRPRPTAAASRHRLTSPMSPARSSPHVDVAIDGGALTGLPSTVVDLTRLRL